MKWRKGGRKERERREDRADVKKAEGKMLFGVLFWSNSREWEGGNRSRIGKTGAGEAAGERGAAGRGRAGG